MPFYIRWFTVKVSIIIPVLNEENHLSEIVAGLQGFRNCGHEVIVVDGGSTDNSLSLATDAAAQNLVDHVIASETGRAVQMNSGAEVATGKAYLFLHADTVLPENALADPVFSGVRSHFWGRYDIRLSGSKRVFRLIEWLINQRSRLSSIATGDQAMFIEAELFNSIGGFPPIALMEDIAISRRLKKRLPPVCLRTRVTTSSRRWENCGVVSTVLLMWKLRLYYFIGVSPDRLQRMYR